MTAKAAQLARSAWPLLQGTLAATLAWVIAKHLFNHHEPFFAPIAAVVALNAAPGSAASTRCGCCSAWSWGSWRASSVSPPSEGAT
jgi:hypothetical protein